MLEVLRLPQSCTSELVLTDGLLVGRGTERECYRHPENIGLCIKVTHRTRNLKYQNRKDFEYFRSLAKRGIDWSHLPCCHGWVTTNRGKGLVFDLLQDDRQRPLPTLKELLVQQQLSLSDLWPALRQLHTYLLRNRIFSSDLRTSNIVADMRKDGHLDLYVIDGLGDRDFIKLASRIAFLGRRKINRQWRRFERRVCNA